MRKQNSSNSKTLVTTIENVRNRLIESATNGDFDAAKKEIDLLQGLIKISNLSENSGVQSIGERRAEREKLLDELNRKLARLNQKDAPKD